MGSTRGKKKHKKGRLLWKNRSANCGRRPTMGKRKGMITWQEVRRKMLANATKVVVPAKTEAEPEAPAE